MVHFAIQVLNFRVGQKFDLKIVHCNLNRTLLSLPRTVPESQKQKWKDSLNKVVHAYNCTRNDATGFSPLYLLFGRSPRLLVDLMFGLSRDEANVTHALMQSMQKNGRLL